MIAVLIFCIFLFAVFASKVILLVYWSISLVINLFCSDFPSCINHAECPWAVKHVSISCFLQCVSHTAVILLQLLSGEVLLQDDGSKACVRRAVVFRIRNPSLYLCISIRMRRMIYRGCYMSRDIHTWIVCAPAMCNGTVRLLSFPRKVFAKIFTLSRCHRLIFAFSEHLLFDETPQILNTSQSLNSQIKLQVRQPTSRGHCGIMTLDSQLQGATFNF